MKPSEWENSQNIDELLEFAGKQNLDRARPARHFACACGRLVWRHLNDKLGRPSIQIVERFLAGQAGWDDLRREALNIDGIPRPTAEPGLAIYELADATLMRITTCGRSARQVAGYADRVSRLIDGKNLAAAQSDLIREIFGNPFWSETFDVEWVSPTARELAREIYKLCAFDRMPILGDALEEAGCPSPRILEHCRGPHKHVRGCWVVEGVLGFRRSLM